MIDLLLKGFLWGLLIAAPVGPIGVLCIRRTLVEGRLAGFMSGLGAATADSLYGLAAAFGLGVLANLWMDWQEFLRLFGGGFLLIIGLRAFFLPLHVGNRTLAGKNYFASYLTTFLLTLANPMTILSFTAVLAGLGYGTELREISQGMWLVIGVFLGSAIWWLILSSVTGIVKEKLNAAHIKWVNRLSGLIIVSFSLLILYSSIQDRDREITSSIQTPTVMRNLPANIDGFIRAAPGYEFQFPNDHGPHLDYQTEWWYFTGNMQDERGRRFGYQLTIFRRALLPSEYRQPRLSTWATDHVYLGHFALTDATEGKHYSFEKLHRGAAGIAGAQADPFSVWIQDWRVRQTSSEAFLLQAGIQRADGSPLKINLEITTSKEPVFHGNQGYSQKGPGEGDASYYYSLTRLDSHGEITIGDAIHTVHGLSWMDHEFSTKALSSGQIGWDWFSIQFVDGSELMVFQIRKQDGSIDPFSSGTWIDPQGKSISLVREDFSIAVNDYWLSKKSGGNYPSAWNIQIDKLDLTLELEPLVQDQEMNLTYTYWEGAVRTQGYRNGIPISGFGYIELTGYAGTMAGEF
jgi:predicted secreted hydrolase/threonine/homoserine/homoserine lactone efflux protein